MTEQVVNIHTFRHHSGTADLARDLRAKVINDPSVPLDLRRVSLRAACALQVMSDRNFGQAPQLIKQQCRTALDECSCVGGSRRS
jgi:hypothetical protein